MSSYGNTSNIRRRRGLTYQFLISDIRALWRSGLSARVPERQKLKTDRLGLYGKVYNSWRGWALKG